MRSDSAFSIRPRRETLDWLARFATACRSGNVQRATNAIRSLSIASLDLHAELAELGTGFERRGTLSVYETGTRFAEGRKEAARSGLRCQVLQGAFLRGRLLHGGEISMATALRRATHISLAFERP